MDSRTIGVAPGSAAPASGNPHGLAPLGAHHRAAVAVAPSKDAVALAGADGIGAEQGETNKRDSAAKWIAGQAREMSNCDNKRFCTLRARLALTGYALSRTQAGDGPLSFYATRWNLVRELRDLASVEAFAERVGAR